MSDGNRIAADVWLPIGADKEHPVSTVVRATRYWRDMAILNRPLFPLSSSEQEALMWTDAGMALISVDVRGTGASFGSWTAPWSEREVADFEEIVDWIIDQEWSDGQVAAQGVSYEGNTADFFGLIGHEAVKAVAPLFTDWNVYTDIAYPGGIYNAGFIGAWSATDQALDRNDICAAGGITEAVECERTKQLMSGVLPVDEDEDQALLEAAVADHAENIDVFEACGVAPYLDNDVGNSHYLAISPAARTESLDSDAATYLAKASWTDAVTANGALSRYMTTDNDTAVYIGAWSHGGEYNTDPFLAADAPTFPSISMQESNMMLQFSKLFSGGELSPKREIHYYIYGAKEWRTTTVWPPENTVETAFHLRKTGELTLEGGESDESSIDYEVDFTASSGETNRWWTQFGGSDVIYPDRSAEDEKLLTYTSSPLDEPMLLAGHPEVYIHLASTHEDGAVYVYLEDVSPEGTVTYLTEGQLRLIHRKISDNPPIWHVFGPYHSFLEADAAPMVPGEPAEIAIMLQPLAALIEAGHSIRVALAGHDASNFVRLPESGDPTLTVYHDADHPSRIILPVN
jgi:putative CocE/NonD family hydrolase